MPDVFSVPIFFIVFREALEAAIIVSVLLALVEQVVRQPGESSHVAHPSEKSTHKDHSSSDEDHGARLTTSDEEERALIRKMRIQIFLGASLGLFISLCIGAAFLAVWFTQVNDLFGANEEIWEGTFNLIAAIIVFIMALAMLRIDKSKAKWRAKLHRAFVAEHGTPATGFARFNPFARRRVELAPEDKKGITSGRWALFLLPFITVLREGLEAVVFIGGVSLGQKATAIPLAAIIGLLCGFIVGFIIYKSSSRTTLSIFLIISTIFLLLIGSGLFSKAIGNFERNNFNRMVGADVAEAGNGPGSYDVRGNIWHLNCCNPEDKSGAAGGWQIFSGIFGWSNNGSLGTVLGYIFYWIAAIVALVVMRINERKRARQGAVA